MLVTSFPAIVPSTVDGIREAGLEVVLGLEVHTVLDWRGSWIGVMGIALLATGERYQLAWKLLLAKVGAQLELAAKLLNRFDSILESFQIDSAVPGLNRCYRCDYVLQCVLQPCLMVHERVRRLVRIVVLRPSGRLLWFQAVSRAADWQDRDGPFPQGRNVMYRDCLHAGRHPNWIRSAHLYFV